VVRTIGGRYAIEGNLGEGGMGLVYRVRHTQLAKQFALKVISPAFAKDEKARERFNVEAQLASEISHPNIVSVVDFGEDEELGAYMVMELVEGEPFMFAEGSQPLSVRRALDVLAQVADALDHIHKRGVIHGDIKAENLILAEEPTSSGARRRKLVRLLDFGLAMRLGTQETELNGTPHYLAPERCTGSAASVASDIYALGVLGYLLLTRTMPFDGNLPQILDAHVNKVPPPIAERRGEDIDDSIDTLIMRAMSKQPALRHPSAAAFRYELNNVMHMLEMTRRRQSQPKLERKMDAAAMLFEQSMLAQVVVKGDNTIRLANPAFGELIEDPGASFKNRSLFDTPLALWVPDLKRALERTRRKRRPMEVRARRWSNELALWFTPAPNNDDIHILVQNHIIRREPVKSG
jgi:eukaryotic-like serine/threonine-protein kinase